MTKSVDIEAFHRRRYAAQQRRSRAKRSRGTPCLGASSRSAWVRNFFIFLTQKFAFWCILVAKNGNMQQWKSCQQASRWLVFRSIIHAWYLYWKVNKTQQWTKALFIFKHDWSSVISETIFATVASRVGPGHCCYRIRPIRFLAGWCKRRPEPGLVYGFVRFSYFGFCVVYYFS